MKRVALESLSSKKTILALVVTLAFGGCVGGNISVLPKKDSKQKDEIALPNWYLNSPNNTAIFLYGSGEGESLEIAKSNALSNMAASLVVSVSSNLQTNTQTNITNGKESYSKDVSKDVKVEVQKIKFTNATVKNNQLIDGKFYLLMQVDRAELFSQKKGEFGSRDGRIEELYSSLNGKSKLGQIHILQDMYPLLKEAKSQAIVLNAINNSFAYGDYLKKYDNYIDKIDDIKSDCIVSVENNLFESYFRDVLIESLNKNRFKIGSIGGKSDILIKLNVQPKYSITNGWNIVKVTTTISVLSENKIVSNKTISTIGRSSTSKESALEDASKGLRDEIETATLEYIIFGK